MRNEIVKNIGVVLLAILLIGITAMAAMSFRELLWRTVDLSLQRMH